jgi:hypothetical protein
MASSGMLRRVALVRTYVSEELSASIIRMTRISVLGRTLAVTSNRTVCPECYQMFSASEPTPRKTSGTLHNYATECSQYTWRICCFRECKHGN